MTQTLLSCDPGKHGIGNGYFIRDDPKSLWRLVHAYYTEAHAVEGLKGSEHGFLQPMQWKATAQAAFDALPAEDPVRSSLAAPVAALRTWNLRTAADSVPTALAVLWAQDLADRFAERIKADRAVVHEFLVHRVTARERLEALGRTTARLERDFGSWQTPWGEINRFQRLTGEVRATFDDAKPSLPIGFAPSAWGSLAAFGTAASSNPTKRIYGNRGNSFVAVVEFGPQVRAKSVLAGGVSGDPASPHFNDQAALYAAGKFKDVLFHRADVERGARRRYHPGEYRPE